MPRKQTVCVEDGCERLTWGLRCQPCSGKAKIKLKCSVADKQRHYALKKKYDLSLEEFEVYWQAFYGRCGICGEEMEMPANRRGQNLKAVTVDHCHKTGKVRGLLCGGCNKGIGFLKDDPILVEKALEWLNYGNQS